MLGLSLCLASGSSGDGGSASPPVNTTRPIVSYSAGTGFVGDTVSCDTGTWENATSFTYQWKRVGSVIGGATSSTYELVDSDAGQTLVCEVTATGPGGFSAEESSNSLTPLELFGLRFIDNPGITGENVAPTTLTVSSPGTWESNPPQAAPSLSYLWLRDSGTPLGSEITQAATDPGDYYVLVTLTPVSGSPVQAESNHITVIS
jgi:hypothetical protein